MSDKNSFQYIMLVSRILSGAYTEEEGGKIPQPPPPLLFISLIISLVSLIFCIRDNLAI